MRKYFYLPITFLLAFYFSVSAIEPERILVEGGKMIQKDDTIEVESFQISKYEITNSEFVEFLNAKKVDSNGIFKGKQMINISWGYDPAAGATFLRQIYSLNLQMEIGNLSQERRISRW